MTSITKIVNQIIDSLSEAVSELTMLVVKNKEHNLPIPPELPPSVTGVLKASGVLTDVARKIADHEYASYPRIKKRMNQAATDMDAASQSITASLDALSGDDRATGWQKLADSCKSIAGKTTTLLSLVYGAEVKRFFEVSEQALEAIEQTRARVALADKDPQGLANAAQDAAQHLANMAAYAKKLAQEQESDVMKKDLEKYGNDLAKQSDNLIDGVNAVLRDPTNEANKQNFLNELDKTKQTISGATDPLAKGMEQGSVPTTRDDQAIAESAKKLQEEMEELFQLAQKIKANPNDNQLKQRFGDLMEAVKLESRQLALAAPDNKQIQELKKKVDRIIAKLGVTAGGNIDINELVGGVNDLAKNIAMMVGAAKKDLNTKNGADSKEEDAILAGLEKFLQSNQGQEMSKQDLERVMKQLDQLDISATKAPAQQPTQAAKQQEAAKEAAIVQESLEGVANNLRKATHAAQDKRQEKSKKLVASCGQIADQLSKFAAASKKGSGTELLESARSIAGFINEVNAELQALKAKCRDPVTQDKIVRMSQALRNYSIQLKILSSVFASSATHSKREDNQLIHLAKNLGSVLTDTIGTIEAAVLAM